MDASAFKLGEQFSVVQLQALEHTTIKKPTRIAFHFALDNSASMGSNTNLALKAFSPLVDMATDPCSLTVFDSSAVTLSASLWTAQQMCACSLPRQGQTNISEGVERALDVVLDREAMEPSCTHHVLILLSDGGHNSGRSPETAVPCLRATLKSRAPDARLSGAVLRLDHATSGLAPRRIPAWYRNLVSIS